MLYGPTFQRVPLGLVVPHCRSYNPVPAATGAVWALPRSLATTGGITSCFIFLQVIRCFSSLRSPPLKKGDAGICNPAGCPIRISPDQRVCAPPRSFSQLVTSFIASKSLGIHHAPFLTFSPPFITPVVHPILIRAQTVQVIYTFSFSVTDCLFLFDCTSCHRTKTSQHYCHLAMTWIKYHGKI